MRYGVVCQNNASLRCRHPYKLMNLLTIRRIFPLHALALLAVAAVTGCGGSAAFVAEKLDPVTSVTIRYSGHRLVFFRSVAGRAASARDYVDLAPIESNRSGDRRYYLWLGIWTVDHDTAASVRDEFGSVVILADNESIELAVSGWTAQTIGASEPVYKKPVASAVDAYYEVTIEQLRQLAAAADLRLRSADEESRTFEPWDDQARGKVALLEFLRGPTY